MAIYEESPKVSYAGDADAPLVIVGVTCGAQACPTIYRTSSGTLLVQGKTIDPAVLGVDLPPGEAMVEIPAQLLAEFAAALAPERTAG